MLNQMNVLKFCVVVCFVVAGGGVFGNELDSQQKRWYEKYKGQENAPRDMGAMLLNGDKEPGLKKGFVSLFNGKDLSGWELKGGDCKFEVKDGAILGTTVKGSNSTYLSTTKSDYEDFIFTCEMKWLVQSNSGVMIHAQEKEGKGGSVTVFGPQVEMEGYAEDRYWSGGIYGQSCGGYFYPLWLKEHRAARAALKKMGTWNRLTVSVKGNVVKTWINGVPAAHWVDDGTYAKGFFGLQIHKGNEGAVLWRNLRVKTPEERQKR